MFWVGGIFLIIVVGGALWALDYLYGRYVRSPSLLPIIWSVPICIAATFLGLMIYTRMTLGTFGYEYSSELIALVGFLLTPFYWIQRWWSSTVFDEIEYDNRK